MTRDHGKNPISEKLAVAAKELRAANSMVGGKELGLSCIVEVPYFDSEVARLFSGASELTTELFQRNVRPTRALLQVPLVQAYRAAIEAGAEGPIRIFVYHSGALACAEEQAALDIGDGLCSAVMILQLPPGADSAQGRVVCPKH